ncbi:MAG: GNAT family N-acetyltransferase [Treponema sp.]|jgi:GNAT superfamily N-acetyltransferase|nr:GNAT family N-acetyltransferase [Treponema sp.]
MFFELTRALIDEILFCMEDQSGDFLLDMRESELINTKFDDIAGDFYEREERFIRIPEWRSSDGFFIMEQFASGCRNSVVRDALTQSLERGKGVFRAFKDVLTRYPETERRWFAFKTREMKRRIIQWYNGLRESWNMEKIGFEEPEETEELVLEDFLFRDYGPDDAATIAALHRACVEDNPHYADYYAENKSGMNGKIILAEAAERGIAGFAAALRQGSASCCRLVVEIKPEYRGLGLGSELCARMVDFLKNSHGTETVYIDVPVESDGFSRYLIRSSFSPTLTRYVLSV